MQIIFSGVGEAFDEGLTNTSLIVLVDGSPQKQILLDCGFTAAHAFWQTSPDPMNLDALWISHFHGDHFFGVPLLLLRFWEEERSRPLTIVGQRGVENKVRAAMELAYPGFNAKLSFEINYIEAHPGQDLNLLGLGWSFAPTMHSKPCLGLRLDSKSVAMYYSGDGRPSEKTGLLARGCHLIVHEAYGLEPMLDAHGTVDGCIAFANKTEAKHLALVHMNRRVRKEHADEVRRQLGKLEDIHAFLPEPGETLTIGESRE